MEGMEKILVVDDSMVNLMALRGILERANYEVMSAINGKECRQMALEHNPDLILLDIMMPGESGLDTCAILKKEAATSDIPVIFQTCVDDMDTKLNGLSLGAVDYITKPYNHREILARVRTQLSARKNQQRIISDQKGRLGQIRDAQQAMLVGPEDLPEAKFSVVFDPMFEAGGDFYDVLDFGGGKFGYFVADVRGHDLGASFLTPSLKALFRQNATSNTTPDETLVRMNRVLNTMTLNDIFLTACYVIIDRDLGQLSISCSGHPPVLLVSRDGQSTFLETVGDVMGAFEEIEVDFKTYDIRTGDRIFLYSDGLLEKIPGMVGSVSENKTKLVSLCSETMTEALSQAVKWVVSSIRGDAPPSDDVVLLGVEV